MKNKIYTNVYNAYDKILLREKDKNGKETKVERAYNPYVYIATTDNSEYKTITGESVNRLDFSSYAEYREFIKDYSQVKNMEIHGVIGLEYQYIHDTYPETTDYSFDVLDIMYFDIETTCDDGFPVIETANEKIISIALKRKNDKRVYCLGKYVASDPSVQVFCFEDEKLLLKSFLDYFAASPPDILTGWNIKFFDVPYLVNRIKNVFSAKESKRLSPWKMVKEKTVNFKGKDNQVYDIVGISTLDYYELYQKFTYVTRESYSLNNISYAELGETKLVYDEYDNISDFYKNDFQKFVEYNIHDVTLVEKLEAKLKLIELAVALAYNAGVNFSDVFSQVKTWDVIIYNYLLKNKIVVPPKKHSSKDEQFAGAYVKDPIVGMHDWVVSFDLNSLYPHLIMQYNISTETITKDGKFKITPIGILNNDKETLDVIAMHKKKDLSVAANGTTYIKTKRGFLPDLMDNMYKDRKMFKGKMIDAQKELELVNAELKIRQSV